MVPHYHRTLDQDKIIDEYYSAEEIARRVDSMAHDIAMDLKKSGYTKEGLTVVSILKGAMVFTCDLIRALHKKSIQLEVDMIHLSSYGTEKSSSGSVKVISDITQSVIGRNVLIVDDILESGRTLSFAKNLLTERGASSVKSAIFLEKPGKRLFDVKADYVGFIVPDKYVVGYGLDYANRYRELPYIGILEG